MRPGLDKIINAIGDTTHLDLNGTLVGDDYVILIVRALVTNTKIVSIDLERNQITHVGARHLANLLKVNSTLVSISLFNNNIGDRGARHLANALMYNSSMRRIDVGYNGIGRLGARHLANSLAYNTTVSCMNLNYNDIGIVGMSCIAHALMYNSKVTAIKVAHNETAVYGVRPLANMLMYNSTVTCMDLSYNKVKLDDMRHIVNILRYNTTIASIGLVRFGGSTFEMEYSTNQISNRLKSNRNGQRSKRVIMSSETTQIAYPPRPIELVLRNDPKFTIADWSKDLESKSQVNRLAKALENNTHVTSLDVSDNSLFDNDIRELFSVLEKNTTIKFLNVSLNNLKGDGLARLLSANSTIQNIHYGMNLLRHSTKDNIFPIVQSLFNSALTHLDLSGNDLNDQDICQLAGVLRVNTTLVELGLGLSNFTERGIKNLCRSLVCNTTLTTLFLHNNNLGKKNKSIHYLARLLACNTTLKTLDLSNNHLESHHIKDLCRGIQNNTSLQHMRLDDPIGLKGGQYIGECLRFNKSLVTLDVNRCGEDLDFLHVALGLIENTSLVHLGMTVCMDRDRHSHLASLLCFNSSLATVWVSDKVIKENTILSCTLEESCRIKKAMLHNSSVEEIFYNSCLEQQISKRSIRTRADYCCTTL